MTKNKLLELINKEIDGSISRSERKNLEEYVQSNPDSNKVYDEMISLNEALDTAAELEPPHNLTKKIMARIDRTKYLPQAGSSRSWSWLFSPRLRIAYSFMGGLLLGIILLGLFNNQFGRNIQSISGTMGLSTERIAAIPITAGSTAGNIVVTRNGRHYTLEVNLESNEIYEIVIGYTPDNIAFTSIVPTAPQKTVIERVQNQLRLSGYKNAHHILTFTKKSDEADFLRIMIVVSQEQIISKELILE
jgi:hypothetical protein